MRDTSSVVAIIPARGGSKGLPRKNVLTLGGKPLIAWSIEAALQCSLVDRVIVTTDDAEIADVSKSFGAEVPFIRPPELAEDDSLTEDVLKHAVEWLENNEKYFPRIVLFLQPTDPFRSRTIVSKVLSALIDNPELDSVFAACPEHKNFWMKKDGKNISIGRHNYLPRAEKEPIYREDCGIALATRTKIIKQGKRIGENVSIIPHKTIGSHIDIHSEHDLWLANQIINKYGVDYVLS